jgi:hypothetical protein
MLSFGAMLDGDAEHHRHALDHGAIPALGVTDQFKTGQ